MSNRQLHSFKEYKSLKTYLFLAFNPRTCVTFFKCVNTALRRFFLLQFSVKWKLRKIPVVPVDNALDKKIPFTPERITIYLDFIHSLARPLGYIISNFKGKERAQICNKLVAELRNCYFSAYDVYSFRMSTTDRPKYKKDRHFRLIHAVDPHLMCVPSLHVAIMIMAWIVYREIFSSSYFSEEEKQHYTAQVFESARSITETVLYVKQHSVNCIPAAIYMMTVLLKDRFTVEDAVNFMDSLFVQSTDLTQEIKDEIHTYIHTMFERFLLEGCSNEDWTAPIKNWLLTYKAS